LNADSARNTFSIQACRFMELTEDYVKQGVNPGGYYKAVWCRDASYILKDWFLSGRMEDVMQEVMFLWSHQITQTSEKLVYGRGSPEMKYLSRIAKPEVQEKFDGAMPTTIFHGFSEVYSQNPDIDSTALTISTTSWILNAYLKAGLFLPPPSSSSFSSSVEQELDKQISTVVSDPSVVINFAIPRMLKAVDYLASRDIDGDGLLEQGHNEDWMDTVLRAGKIVYSQACWILALSNLSELLSELGNRKEVDRIMALAIKTMDAVERHLWSEEDCSYIDLQETDHIGVPHMTLTQDVSLYIIALTENMRMQNMLEVQLKNSRKGKMIKYDQIARAVSTLDAIKTRIWQNKWPLVTEAELKTTGPWKLHPNQYHNHTFWPWTTGIEMQARSCLSRFEECDQLMSTLLRGNNNNSPNDLLAFYEWINPTTGKGDGAFPFRTGISTIRIAITDILSTIQHKTSSRISSQ
jgi:glycogen debranching enzyme